MDARTELAVRSIAAIAPGAEHEALWQRVLLGLPRQCAAHGPPKPGARDWICNPEVLTCLAAVVWRLTEQQPEDIHSIRYFLANSGSQIYAQQAADAAAGVAAPLAQRSKVGFQEDYSEKTSDVAFRSKTKGRSTLANLLANSHAAYDALITRHNTTSSRESSVEGSSSFATQDSGDSRRFDLNLTPNCRTRMIWDMTSFLIICIETLFIPVEIGFDVDFGMGWLWFTTVFFTVDICLNLVTAYYDENGNLVKDRQMIIRHYLTSKWFFIDLGSTVPWQMIFLSNSGSGSAVQSARALKMSKLTKMCRLIRMVKAFRFLKALSFFQSVMTDPFKRAVMIVCGVLLCFLYALHINACMWGFLGSYIDNSEQNPKDDCIQGGACENGVDGRPWMARYHQLNKDQQALYVISAYHASARLVQSFVEITPGTDIERLHVIVAQVANFFLCAFCLAVIHKTWLNYDSLEEEINQALNKLRQLMSTKAVPVPLRMKIERHLEWKRATTRRNLDHYEPYLMCISPSLRSELKYSIFGRSLRQHPFFGQLPHNALLEICLHARTMDMLPGDVVLNEGETAQAMLLVLSGGLGVSEDSHYITEEKVASNRYTINVGTIANVVKESDVVSLGVDSWIGDSCLFELDVPQKYSIIVEEPSELLCITPAMIESLVDKFNSIEDLYLKTCQEYKDRHEPDLAKKKRRDDSRTARLGIGKSNLKKRSGRMKTVRLSSRMSSRMSNRMSSRMSTIQARLSQRESIASRKPLLDVEETKTDSEDDDSNGREDDGPHGQKGDLAQKSKDLAETLEREQKLKDKIADLELYINVKIFEREQKLKDKIADLELKASQKAEAQRGAYSLPKKPDQIQSMQPVDQENSDEQRVDTLGTMPQNDSQPKEESIQARLKLGSILRLQDVELTRTGIGQPEVVFGQPEVPVAGPTEGQQSSTCDEDFMSPRSAFSTRDSTSNLTGSLPDLHQQEDRLRSGSLPKLPNFQLDLDLLGSSDQESLKKRSRLGYRSFKTRRSYVDETTGSSRLPELPSPPPPLTRHRGCVESPLPTLPSPGLPRLTVTSPSALPPLPAPEGLPRLGSASASTDATPGIVATRVAQFESPSGATKRDSEESGPSSPSQVVKVVPPHHTSSSGLPLLPSAEGEGKAY